MNNFFEEAKIESQKSTDLRKPIGVIITVDDRIIGRGSNQATIKFKWLINWHKTHCLRKILGIKKHAYYWLCPGCALYKNHAEIRAIKSMKNYDYSQGGNPKMYMYGHNHCCSKCILEMCHFNIMEVNFSNE